MFVTSLSRNTPQFGGLSFLHKRAFFSFSFFLFTPPKRMSLFFARSDYFCFYPLILPFLITVVMPRRKLCHVRLLCATCQAGRTLPSDPISYRMEVTRTMWVVGGWKWDHYATHLINHPKFSRDGRWRRRGASACP